MGICYSGKSKGSLVKQEEKSSISTVCGDYVPISELTIKEDINLKFNFISSIGKGTFGLVREAIEIGTNNRYAIKTLLKSKHEGERSEFLKKEVEILNEIKDENPHIISCYNVYEDRNSVHIIFDLIEGGDLFDYISDSTDNNNYLTEKQAVGFFVQILDALHFLYNKRIVHRDIKLENFLIIQKDKDILLKLIDFGFASKVPECGFLTEPIGSPYNVAPEILLGKSYDFKVDIWAAGVLLYNMVSGKQPFSGESEEELAEKIINNEVQFIDEVFLEVSKECIELIKLLLRKNPAERPTAFEVKNHSYIQSMINILNAGHNPTVCYKFEPNPNLIQDILNSLNTGINLKNEIFSLMLTHMEIGEAETSINFLKQHNNQSTEIILSKSTLSFEKVLEAIKKSACSEILRSRIDDVLKKKLHICKRQRVDYNEFFFSFINCKEIIRKERIWNIFKNYDINNGHLNINQVKQAFEKNQKKFDFQRAKEILKLGSEDHLHSFTFAEFIILWDDGDLDDKSLNFIKNKEERRTEFY